MGVWYGPKYGYSRKKGALYALTMGLVFSICSRSCQWIFGVFGVEISLNSYRTFLFTPLFAFVLGRLFKIPMLQGTDYMTPIMFFSRAICLIGCIISGCALAIPCDWGIYSPNIGCRVFPMDPIDLLGTVTAGVVALVYAKNLHYNGNGRIYAFSMYILGFVRLFLQLGSTDYWWIRGFNDESVYSIVAIIMTMVIYGKWYKENSNKMEEK